MTKSIINSMEVPFKRNSIGGLTVIFALCSILYELLLAQSLSSIMGNTILRYNMTIGLYVAAMGFGAIVYNKIKNLKIDQTLLLVEFFLALIGFMAPVLVLIFDRLMFSASKAWVIPYYSDLIQTPIFIFNHFLIVAIGFLSGFELPLLMDAFKRFSQKSSLGILGLDYVGTLLGAISFPVLILPYFSIFQIAAIVAVMNLSGAIFFGLFVAEKKNNVLISVIVILLFIVLLDAFNFYNLENYVLTHFYYR